MANLNEMTISEFTGVFNYLLDNNQKLQEQGLTPIAIGIEGAAGIGKTSVIQQVAEKRGMTFCKLNLSQLEEVGDMVGFPQKEVLLQWTSKDGTQKTKWWPENLISKVPSNVTITNKTRMGYAPPSWLPQENNPNGTILALDDYTRANQLFMQATMELINEGKYISWSLPENTSVVLTTNPDDGEFSVQSLDSAQKTRFINFNLKLDVRDWATWAEFNNVDSRA
jgi:MoxR-like ATPase